jgi:hypothetical protein
VDFGLPQHGHFAVHSEKQIGIGNVLFLAESISS